MIQQVYTDICTPELLEGAIENNEFEGFREDYHVLHCLLKKYAPKSVFEIGTNYGTGTKIIKNAVGAQAVVFTLDLPYEQTHPTLKVGGKDMVGSNCNLPFVQLRGDSVDFDYSRYPCDGYFIDGEHDYWHCFTESMAVLQCHPNIIIWHDLHVVPVQDAIRDAVEKSGGYVVYCVSDTRIAYALKA